jgi:NAD-dependent SIR2 family protein deacetylase
MSENEKNMHKVVEFLKSADYVLIGAGAGLSADAGNDYMDKGSFAKNYPELVKLGFQFKAQLMGYEILPPDLEWSYLARHVSEARFQDPPQEVYQKLFEIVQDKDYFVITSNVDMLFVKNGFDDEKLYTPQGDYALMQCLGPCWNKTWKTKPIIDKILPKIDVKTKKLTDLSVIPKCPTCGGPVFMNVRGGAWFIDEPYKEQAKRFYNWIQKVKGYKLLIFEIGAGFNTPGVVRWPMERIALNYEKSNLIRINLYHPQIPHKIFSRSMSFKTTSNNFINLLWENLELNKKRIKNEN